MWERSGCAIDGDVGVLGLVSLWLDSYASVGLCVQDLEQRYNKLRVEVQMAQDADEAVTLDEVVRRVMRKEKQAAAAIPRHSSQQERLQACSCNSRCERVSAADHMCPHTSLPKVTDSVIVTVMVPTGCSLRGS